MCGAPTCRGTMDSRPERRKDYGKRVEVWWEGDNVYYRGTIFEYSKSTDKHTVYYDDGEKEKVSLATTPHRYAASKLRLESCILNASCELCLSAVHVFATQLLRAQWLLISPESCTHAACATCPCSNKVNASLEHG